MYAVCTCTLNFLDRRDLWPRCGIGPVRLPTAPRSSDIPARIARSLARGNMAAARSSAPRGIRFGRVLLTLSAAVALCGAVPTMSSTPMLADDAAPSSMPSSPAPSSFNHTIKATDNSTTTCDIYYTVYGGGRAAYRGKYNRGPASMSCHSLPVYIQDASNPNYLFSPTGNSGWVITNSQSSMQDCKNTGSLYTAGACACPSECKATATDCGPPGTHSVGAWKENTGATNRGNAGSEAMCDADVWCPSGLWVV